MILLYILNHVFLINKTLNTYIIAEFEENVHIDDSKFGPLELPDSPKNFTITPQVTDFSDILAVSNAIKIFQVYLFYFLNYK